MIRRRYLKSIKTGSNDLTCSGCYFKDKPEQCHNLDEDKYPCWKCGNIIFKLIKEVKFYD
jgi:hypothetical protein